MTNSNALRQEPIPRLDSQQIGSLWKASGNAQLNRAHAVGFSQTATVRVNQSYPKGAGVGYLEG